MILLWKCLALIWNVCFDKKINDVIRESKILKWECMKENVCFCFEKYYFIMEMYNFDMKMYCFDMKMYCFNLKLYDLNRNIYVFDMK